MTFDPLSALAQRRTVPRWVDWKGVTRSYSPCTIKQVLEVVHHPLRDFDICNLAFRDLAYFVAGQLHGAIDEWRLMLEECHTDESEHVLSWLENGVDVQKFFRPYKGVFQGTFYNSALPPTYFGKNSRTCKSHAVFQKLWRIVCKMVL